MMQSVQVIIERLKSHPEDFFVGLDSTGYERSIPKFRDITDKLDNLLTENQDGQVHRLWYLEPEEKEALIAAYKEARRARFEASVFHTLLTAPTPVDLAVERMSSSGKRFMQGAMWGGAVPKAEGANIAEHINQEFDKEYLKNYAQSNNTRP